MVHEQKQWHKHLWSNPFDSFDGQYLSNEHESHMIRNTPVNLLLKGKFLNKNVWSAGSTLVLMDDLFNILSTDFRLQITWMLHNSKY